MIDYNYIEDMEKSMELFNDGDPPLPADKEGDDKPPSSKQVPVEPDNLHCSAMDISSCGCCIGDRVIRMARKVSGKYSILSSAHLFSIRNPGGYFILNSYLANALYRKA